MKTLLAAAAALSVASPVSAAVFDFSYSGTGVVAFGQITTADMVDADGFSLVTAITGERNGTMISGLVAPGGLGANDNLLSLTSPFFTNSGITYAAGGANFNIFQSGSSAAGCAGNAEISDDNPNGTCPITQISFTLTPVGTPAIPEPATWAMMIGGFGLVGVAMRRHRQTLAVTYA